MAQLFLVTNGAEVGRRRKLLARVNSWRRGRTARPFTTDTAEERAIDLGLGGKTALVTGGRKGIGRAVARATSP